MDPCRIPVVVVPKDEHTPKVKRANFLVPDDFRGEQMIKIVRDELSNFPRSKALFLFSEHRLVHGNQLLKKYLLEQRDAPQMDILFITYALEDTFG